MRLFQRLRELASDRRGQDMAEYALLAGFIAVVSVSSFPRMSKAIGTIFFWVGEYLISAGGGGGPTGAAQP